MDTKQIKATVDSVSPDYLTAYASVEVIDREGDIIRIDGMDLSEQTDSSPIKIFPDHTYVLESGNPAVIGKVEKLEKTFYKDSDIPALKFTMSWAKKPDGTMTDLAKAYQELYQSKYMDSFSVGVQKVEGTKIKSGADWEKTKLIEISAASIPANNLANVIKTLKKFNIKVKDMSENIATPNATNAVQGEGYTYGKKDMDEMMTNHMQKCMDHITKSFGDHKEHISKCMDDMCKSINERFDDIESAVSVAEDGPKPEITTKSIKPDTSEKVSAISKALAEIRQSLQSLK